jgi:hypothetical protein
MVWLSVIVMGFLLLVPLHSDYDSLRGGLGTVSSWGYARPILARAFSVVNIHLMRAIEALRCRCEAAISDLSCSLVAMRRGRGHQRLIFLACRVQRLQHRDRLTFCASVNAFAERVLPMIAGAQRRGPTRARKTPSGSARHLTPQV